MGKLRLHKFIAGLSVALSLACCFACHAAPAVEKPETALRKAYPGLPFESVTKTDINGLYEVISGSNILYYYPEKEYLFVGEIYAPPGRSITAERKNEIAARKMKDLPLDKAVKTGSGKTVVVEFTDPDCPFCKRAYEYFKNKPDITRYTFFTPLAHPGAITKVYYILAAKDREKAYHEMFEGKSAAEPAGGYSEATKKLAQEHLEIGKSAGVTGTPTFFINGTLVVGADFQQLDKILGVTAQTK
ncbi:MAG TPA: DsbC family protein [Geobacteraceae bacterium]|nr:DsbC family protein [Geobacteraceae bacterium]